jgi:hypothetical protein
MMRSGPALAAKQNIENNPMQSSRQGRLKQAID